MKTPCFRVSVNSQKLATIGLSGLGGFCCPVSWLHPPDTAEDRAGRLSLHLVIVDGSRREVLTWPRLALRIGDTVAFEVVDFCESTPAPERRPLKRPLGERKEHDKLCARAAAKELGWRVIEPENQTGLKRGTEGATRVRTTDYLEAMNYRSSATTAAFQMKTPCFRVSVNSQKVAIIGLEGPSRIFCSVDCHVECADTPTCELSLGGFDHSSREHLHWPKRDLKVGDTVAIEIVGFCESTSPPERQPGNDIECTKAYVRRAAREFGWRIAEADQEAEQPGAGDAGLRGAVRRTAWIWRA